MVEFTQAAALKNAFVQVAHTLWDVTEPEVQIAFGHPGQTQLDDIVSFGQIDSVQEAGPYGSNRGREETLTLVVVVSIFRAGGPEMEQIASDRGYQLLGDLENYVRKTDTTLGGVVRHCFLGEHASAGSTEPDVLASGRLITIAAQFVAVVRISTP